MPDRMSELMDDLRGFLSATAALKRLHTEITKRVGRHFVAVFTNVVFSGLCSYIIFSAFDSFTGSQSAYLAAFFLIVIFLIVFIEMVNIINWNFVDNVFSRRAVEIFPIGGPLIFVRIFLNNAVSIRVILYLLPFVVVSCYAVSSHPTAVPVITALFFAVYFAATLTYSGVDYVYEIAKYHYPDSVEKMALLIIFAIGGVAYIVAKHHLVDYRQLNDLVYRFIKYVMKRNV